jgi:uridylate kinase
LINDPAAAEAATVVMSGKVMVTAGGTIAAGASVATDASGDAVTASTGNIVMGYATEAAVDGQVIAIELIQGGNAAA